MSYAGMLMEVSIKYKNNKQVLYYLQKIPDLNILVVQEAVGLKGGY